MELKIKNIILYPNNKDLKPRNIEFQENKVNVITGYSQRGKSAIISIIDYCLGSEDCNIPIGLIRRKVDKFAIYISLKNENLFIARDCPEGRKETEIMYLFPISKNGKQPTFENNSWIDSAESYKVNRSYVINYIGSKAGFEKITDKDIDFKNNFEAPSSFRDTSAFLFQPQNIVANPTTIFFKTDTFAHLQRLKILFPLALGYKSFEIINLENEKNLLEKEINEKDNKLKDIKTLYENWRSDIYEYYSKAISLGLTNSDINIETTNVYELKNELSNIVHRVRNKNLTIEGTSLRFAEKLNELDDRKNDLNSELDILKFELSKIERFDSSKEEYLKNAKNEIDNRLKPIDWFIKKKGTNTCPFCGHLSEKAIDELIQLKNSQEKNRLIIDKSNSIEMSFENEKNELKSKIRKNERLLKEIEKNIFLLQEGNKEATNKYQQIFKFIGKIEHILENLDKIEPSSKLSEEIDNLNVRLFKIKREIILLGKKFDRESSLKKVSDCISNYIPILPIEDRNNKTVHLDPERSVNIKIQDKSTNDITFLSRIGSGANHMCYHISTFLGLHEYFQKLPESGRKNYIPSFLVIDQPSQVYFPEKYSNKKNDSKILLDEQSEDLANTKKIFKACSNFMGRTEFKTQIIILEHAPKSTWKDIEHIHLVEEWRGEKEEDKSNYNALIPKEWEE